MSTLRWVVADSLTGKIVGRLDPGEWSYTDPVTGSAQGSVTLALPTDPARVAALADLCRPHVRQILMQDAASGVYVGGGPVTADASRSGFAVTVPFADWRAWFYAAAIRPDPVTDARVEYVKSSVEQMTAMADLAALGLDTDGAPRMVVVPHPTSGVNRQVTVRMFRMVGDALDNIARRSDGPDWWTRVVTDPADPTKVMVQVLFAHPERHTNGGAPVPMRHILGAGGNVLSLSWPQGSVPPSRVFGVDSSPPPDEKWATAADPGLTDGDRLAWDEVWNLPEGVASPESAFAHALSRLDAHSEALGSVEVTLDPARMLPLSEWQPGDRARLLVRDGWRDLDLPAARILSRSLSGVGGDVLELTAAVNLGAREADIDEPPIEEEGDPV